MPKWKGPVAKAVTRVCKAPLVTRNTDPELQAQEDITDDPEAGK